MKIVKEIFINETSGSTRIAIVDNGVLVELFIERPEHQRLVGNIYKGRIQNVIPGMQAAFVNIGHETNAFLPFSEIGNLENQNSFSFSESEDDENENNNSGKQKKSKKHQNDPAKSLKIDNEILVQVIKEPFSGKGPRITTDISIPGSLMVLVPNANYIGISRKITDKYEKRRLRRMVKEFKPDNYGLIVRTIAEGKDHSVLEADFKRIWERWKEMEQKIINKPAPVLAFKDFTTSDQVIRDLFTSDIKRLVVDSKPLYKRILSYLKEVDPELIKNLELKKGKGSIFDEYSIEEQFEKSLKRKVWMKSGAHLVIEHTEAMVVIDVNSGRFIGKKDHEQNSLKINLESAREVARQLRLRDIGGLIVIDFIDLQQPENRKKVFDELKRNLKNDRARVSLTEFSSFGLLEMTRQRIRLNLLHTVSDVCTTCDGLGRTDTPDTVLTRLENWLKRFRNKANDRRLIIKLNSTMIDYINKTKAKALRGFMWDNWMLLDIQEDAMLSSSKFRIYSKKRKTDVTDEV
jgi:ribonuclease G